MAAPENTPAAQLTALQAAENAASLFERLDIDKEVVKPLQAAVQRMVSVLPKPASLPTEAELRDEVAEKRENAPPNDGELDGTD